MKARLVNQNTREEHVVEDRVHAGRIQTCDIVLDDPRVSRVHARIVAGKRGFRVEDLKSANGTFLNGKRVEKAYLRECDVISIGPFSLRFETEGEEATLRTRVAKRAPSLKRLLLYGGPLLVLVLALLALLSARGKRPALGETLTDPRFRFSLRVPRGWQAEEPVEETLLRTAVFDLYRVRFGRLVGRTPVVFAVEVLRGLPRGTSLEGASLFSDEVLPRYLPHAGKILRRKSVELDGLPAEIVRCRFPYGEEGKPLESIEVFCVRGNTRYLLIGATSESLFPKYEKTFLSIMTSFRFGPTRPTLPSKEEAMKRAADLAGEGDFLREKGTVSPGNLFHAAGRYRECLRLLAAADEGYPSAEASAVLRKLAETEERSEKQFRELKTLILKGKNTGDHRLVVESAEKILKIFPDPKDERYRYAQEEKRVHEPKIRKKRKKKRLL